MYQLWPKSRIFQGYPFCWKNIFRLIQTTAKWILSHYFLKIMPTSEFGFSPDSSLFLTTFFFFFLFLFFFLVAWTGSKIFSASGLFFFFFFFGGALASWSWSWSWSWSEVTFLFFFFFFFFFFSLAASYLWCRVVFSSLSRSYFSLQVLTTWILSYDEQL